MQFVAALFFFARWLAIFASVFVGAIPTDTETPVHFSTTSLRCKAYTSREFISTLLTSKNDSSTEYISTFSSPTSIFKVSITRRLISPYKLQLDEKVATLCFSIKYLALK